MNSWNAACRGPAQRRFYSRCGQPAANATEVEDMQVPMIEQCRLVDRTVFRPPIHTRPRTSVPYICRTRLEWNRLLSSNPLL
jgi:hypothetical protein